MLYRKPTIAFMFIITFQYHNTKYFVWIVLIPLILSLLDIHACIIIFLSSPLLVSPVRLVCVCVTWLDLTSNIILFCRIFVNNYDWVKWLFHLPINGEIVYLIICTSWCWSATNIQTTNYTLLYYYCYCRRCHYTALLLSQIFDILLIYFSFFAFISILFFFLNNFICCRCCCLILHCYIVYHLILVIFNVKIAEHK